MNKTEDVVASVKIVTTKNEGEYIRQTRSKCKLLFHQLLFPYELV